jgi:uridine phosphorylase
LEEYTFIINPEDVRNSARVAGIRSEVLEIPDNVIITFNRPIIEELTKICRLKEWDWEAKKFTPYSAAQKCMKGVCGDVEIAVFVPPMGASSLAAFCEELIVYGARCIFLLCASWSLGEEYLRKGQIHVPDFAVGMDGTSYHYGNTRHRVDADPKTLEILKDVLTSEGVDWKQGGVGCCEAFYRITREMLDSYRKQGCLSMENGEVATLYALARLRRINAGVLLQSYTDNKYAETCVSQARTAVKAMSRISSAGAGSK